MGSSEILEAQKRYLSTLKNFSRSMCVTNSQTLPMDRCNFSLLKGNLEEHSPVIGIVQPSMCVYCTCIHF